MECFSKRVGKRRKTWNDGVESSESKRIGANNEGMKPGSIITCRVISSPDETRKLGFLRLSNFHSKRIRLRSCEVSDYDDWKSFPFKSLPLGAFLRVVVLTSIPSTREVNMTDVSLRPSILEQSEEFKSLSSGALEMEVMEAKKFPAHGSLVKGFVERVDPKIGVFVRVSRCVCGIVPLKYLADNFVSDVVKEFEIGKLVAGRVMESNEDVSKLVLSLRRSSVVGDTGLHNLKAGMRLDGTVNSVVPYGIFVRLKDESGLVGLCHRKELTDDEGLSETAYHKYAEGDCVRVYIISAEKDKNGKPRIALSLKASHFADEIVENNFHDESDSDIDNLDVDDSSEEEELDSKPSSDLDDETDSDSESVENDDPADSSISLQEALAKIRTSEQPNTKTISSDSEGSDDEDQTNSAVCESDAKETKKRTSSKHRAQKRRLIEMETSAMEKALIEDANNPTSADDFERLILSSTDSSMLWIQYMSFLAAAANLEQARNVAERGLRSINFRQEKEIENLWLAYIQLENRFGSADSVAQLSKRMLSQVTNRKHILFRLADMYEADENFSKADEALRKASKEKKGTSKQAWMRRIELRFKQGEISEATSLLQEAVRIVPKKKKVYLAIQFARLEYSLTGQGGSVERARTMCEELLANFPKRNDIWLQYIHMEIKYGGEGKKDRVDALFERAISVNFSVKKIRSFFKEWLRFATENGSEQDAEEVKIRARAYVESLGETN